MEHWHWWIIVGIGLFILEIFAPGFVLACLGIGAVLTAIVAAMDVSLELQFIVFAIVSVISFFSIRPFVLKYLDKKEDFKSNTDSVVGRTAIVTKAFDPDQKKGRVKVDGDDWMAYSLESVVLNVGDRVEVVEVDSNTLFVKPK